MHVKVKKRILDIDGIAVTAKIGKRDRDRYDCLIEAMNRLLELQRYGSMTEITHITKQIEEAIERQDEARDIRLNLNGPGHGSLSSEEARRMLDRLTELQNIVAPKVPA